MPPTVTLVIRNTLTYEYVRVLLSWPATVTLTLYTVDAATAFVVPHRAMLDVKKHTVHGKNLQWNNDRSMLSHNRS